jgi:hypothetical protein
LGSTGRNKDRAAIRLSYGLQQCKFTNANDNVDMGAVRLAA